MDLILWRHAEAEDGRPGADLERALTERGRDQAARMAAWLDARLAPSTRVLASPALRCRQTAAALGRSFVTVAALGPGESAEALLAAAGWPDADAPVLVVGHQPTLGQVAALVLDDGRVARHVPKAAAWWLRRENDDEGGSVRLHAAQSPDEL